MIRRSLACIALPLLIAGCATQAEMRPERLIVDHDVTSISQLPPGANAIDKRDLSRLDMGVDAVSRRAITPKIVTDALGARTAKVTKIADGFIVTVQDTEFFDHPRSKIRPASMPAITKLAAAMLKDPGTSLDIVAHYNSDGLPAKALAESQKRAVAIQASLASRGVPAARTRAIGAGERTPVATNFDPLGQQMNRRIDFIFRK